MKKTLLAFGLLFVCFGARAQFSIPDSYYINRAKKQLEAEEAGKVRRLTVVGTVEGRLSYVIRDGKRTTYSHAEEKKPVSFYLYPGFGENFSAPLRPVEKKDAERPSSREDDFALLLEELCRERWMIVSLTGNSDSAVYVFEKMEKPK